MATAELETYTSVDFGGRWGEEESATPKPEAIACEFAHCEGTQLGEFIEVVVGICELFDDDDETPPTVEVISAVLELIESAANEMGEKFRRGHVTTLGDGGLQIEWWYERSYCVILLGDAKGSLSIFCKLPEMGRGSMVEPVRPSTLVRKLRRLQSVQ